jgi:type II secretory pathway pseudopilin PulG
LVELLVVIAIIGILVALLLPAIQAAREASRRSQCTSQLKQVGLAVQMHHDQKGAFPPGRTGTQQFDISWAFNLLPYAEEPAIHASHVPTERVDSAANATAMRTPVATFVCPSRRAPAADRNFDNDDTTPLPEARGVAAGGDYAANAGRGVLVGFDGPTRRMKRQVDPAEVGPMFTYSKVSARRVVDGLSKTLAAGEKNLSDPPAETPEEMRHYQQGDTAYFAGDNPTSVLRASTPGLRPDSDPSGTSAATVDGDAAAPTGEPREAFGGPHPGVTLFAVLDGHVEALANDTPTETLHRLAAIGDGETVE